MINRRRFSQLASAMALPLGGAALANPAYKAEYRISTVTRPGNVWYRAAEQFVGHVTERTKGRIRMKLYPGSTLVQGQQDRELVALRQGVIDGIIGSTSGYAGSAKEFPLFHIPFLMPSAKAVDAVLASDALRTDFYEVLRRNGMEALASAEYGAFQLINNKRRVAVPADLKGLKIRTALPLQQDILSAFGANPTSMSFADAVPALTTGAVDGLLMTGEQFVGGEVHKLGLKHFTRWNIANELVHFGIASSVWKSWAIEDQDIVRDVAKAMASELTAGIRKARSEEDTALKAAGVELVDVASADLNPWKSPVQPVYDKWKAKTDAAIVAKVERTVAAIKP